MTIPAAKRPDENAMGECRVKRWVRRGIFAPPVSCGLCPEFQKSLPSAAAGLAPVATAWLTLA
jgi:hypothetical protein